LPPRVLQGHSYSLISIFPKLGTVSHYQGNIHRPSRFTGSYDSSPSISESACREGSSDPESDTWTRYRLFRQYPGRMTN
jgi:hypothetical protein